MSSSPQCFTVCEALGVKSIQPIKAELAQKGLLDSVLTSNLDFAMRAVEAMSISKRKDALLQLEGEKVVLKITARQPIFHLIVWNDGDGPKLLQKNNVNKTNLTLEDIDASHFIGHCCRDEVKSCMEQAHDKVASREKGLANVELRIICGELQLTYITQEPSKTIEIRPERRARIGWDGLIDVCRVKHHMEMIGEMSPGVMACFRLLFTCFYKLVNKEFNRFLLISEGQKIEFICNEKAPRCAIILFDAGEVQIYSKNGLITIP